VCLPHIDFTSRPMGTHCCIALQDYFYPSFPRRLLIFVCLACPDRRAPADYLLNKINLFSRTQHMFIFFFKICLSVCATCFGLYLGHHQAYQHKNFIKRDIVNFIGQSIERTNLLILLINELQNLYQGPKIATELREENLKKKYHAASSIIHKNHRITVVRILTTTHKELNLIKVFICAV
jgi:hypothetical protein